MLTLFFYILFLFLLYYATKTVIKTAVASNGLLFPDLEKLNLVWNLRWDSWSKTGRVKMRMFYYLCYVPCVILMFFLDIFLLAAFFYVAYQSFIR